MSHRLLDVHRHTGIIEATAMMPMEKSTMAKARNSLGDQLTAMSEEDRCDWAFELLQKDLTDEDIIALDVLGWKLVEKDPSSDGLPRWPFDSKATGCYCPDWCDDNHYDESPKKPGEVVPFPASARPGIGSAIDD
jgi:hypothetical protein